MTFQVADTTRPFQGGRFWIEVEDIGGDPLLRESDPFVGNLPPVSEIRHGQPAQAYLTSFSDLGKSHAIRIIRT